MLSQQTALSRQRPTRPHMSRVMRHRDYFAQPDDLKLPDVRKHLSYQVGATPSMVEIPICRNDPACKERIKQMSEHDKPLPISGADPKWRFFWRIGDRPTEGGFEDLNADPVYPAHFPKWGATMDNWGKLMLASVTTCAQSDLNIGV